MAGTGKNPGGKGWLMGNWNHYGKMMLKTERDGQQKESGFSLLLNLQSLASASHSYWKIFGKDKQERVFKRKMRKKSENKQAMTDRA